MAIASEKTTRKAHKIRPFLWFNDQAEEAAKFYVSVFKNSKVGIVSYYRDDSVGRKGQVMVVTFELDGQQFLALNGGPHFTFTPAISFLVNCESQAEIDEYWARLTADGGEPGDCGWLKDKYGVSWQIAPSILGELLTDDDAERSLRVMQEMLKMKKIDVAALQRAYEGG